MSFSTQVRARTLKLQKAQADLPAVLTEVARESTLAAIEAAEIATPPTEGARRGVNTITGELKASWRASSESEPRHTADGFVTALANNMQYASYVNDGHRMDRHFVPGLYIDPETGLLSRDLTAKVGIMVGTKTKYVKGRFMTEKARLAREKTVLTMLDGKLREMIDK